MVTLFDGSSAASHRAGSLNIWMRSIDLFRVLFTDGFNREFVGGPPHSLAISAHVGEEVAFAGVVDLHQGQVQVLGEVLHEQDVAVAPRTPALAR